MSLLTLIKSACNNIGILAPNQVAGNTDPQIMQLLSLANTEGKLLAKRHDWQVLHREATFTTVALELQGEVETFAPGYRNIVNDTLWNRTLNRPLYGVGPQDWQGRKAAGFAGPYNEYRIKAGEIHLSPAPIAGETIAFEYITRDWCFDIGGSGGRSAWLMDSDVGRLDEDLMLLGIIWRWRKTKGFDYAEDFDTYERQVVADIGRDGTKQSINFEGLGAHEFGPGVFVPSGNWT